MAGMVAKYAMKKALGKEMEKYKSKDVSGPYVSESSIISTCVNSLYPRTPTTHCSQTQRGPTR